MPPKPTNKPKRVQAEWLSAKPTQSVFATLNRGNVRTRAVGGAVRNTLMDLPASDIDFATTTTPEDVMRLAQAAGMSAHPTGIAHGTITLVCDHQTFEVTTLRKDVSTDGRRATVAFTTNWEDDAKRRDFTINALYCDADGTLFDPLNGYRDLKTRTIRFIDDPRQRIREDYLRILRFFRFFASVGRAPIDPTGLAACEQLRQGIETLSGERIRGEVLRLLSANDPLPALKHMNETQVWEATFAKPATTKPLANLIKIESARQLHADGLLRLAVLMVQTNTDAAALTKRLKLSNTESSRLANIASHANDPTGKNALARQDERARREILYRLGLDTYADICLYQWAHSGASPSDPAHKKTIELPTKWTPPHVPFSGADLVARGFEPGPRIGNVLSQFETWWINEDFPDNHERLEQMLNEIARNT